MKFADFEVDPGAGILRRAGVRVKLQDLPFRLLVILLERPGAVVTRDELRAALWGAETFVDAEAGLNTAIAKIREALGESSEAPRFIETLPKRGYRFIGTIAGGAEAAVIPAPATARVARRLSSRPWLIAAGGVVVAALAFVAWSALAGPPPLTLAVVRFHNETGDAAHDRLAGSLTDAVVVTLAENDKYAVIGNSPLLRTDRIFQDVRKIGTALEADFVVLGQLQAGAGGLVARAHLIRVSDETHLWAAKIDLAGVADAEQVVATTVAKGVVTGLGRR